MYYYFSRFSILLASMMCIVLAPGSAASEIHIVHCLYGCPTGMPSTNDLVIREIYSSLPTMIENLLIGLPIVLRGLQLGRPRV